MLYGPYVCVVSVIKETRINKVDEIFVLNWDTIRNKYVSHEPASEKSRQYKTMPTSQSLL